MLKILRDGGRFCDGATRRSFLQIGGLAMGGLALPDILRAEAASEATMETGVEITSAQGQAITRRTSAL